MTEGENHTAVIKVRALSYANTVFTSAKYKDDAPAVNAMTSLYYYYLAARSDIRSDIR